MKAKPKCLDLYCRAGGAGMGFDRAGYDVTGVDLFPQPDYPFHFVQADAITYLLKYYKQFDLIHASPPCQGYSKMRSRDDHPDLIAPTLDALIYTGKPFDVENIEKSPLTNFVLLCGTMFGLNTIRHRVFKCNPMILFSPAACNHHGESENAAHGQRRKKAGKFITVTGHVSPIAKARAAMGIDWMKRADLVEAIPPAYTQWVGKQMMQYL